MVIPNLHPKFQKKFDLKLNDVNRLDKILMIHSFDDTFRNQSLEFFIDFPMCDLNFSTVEQFRRVCYPLLKTHSSL